MITALTGQLQALSETPTAAHLQAGHMVFELLVPAADVHSLRAQIGAEITFHTILYLEGSAGGGNLDPKLIGFQSADDKRFFNLFTTVKGIGPKTALRALSVPAGEIAQAIESKDTRALTQLDGIGKRTAELIVAELCGKVKDFALAHVGALVGAHAGGNGAHAHLRRTPAEEDAILAMTTLGERRPDAERLLERVKQLHPETKTTDALLREMLRVRGGR
jgi:Holliday junction DNA helicase RuvA